MIPMVVLKVKSQEEGLLLLSEISGPSEALEGEEVEFRLTLSRTDKDKGGPEEIRVDVSANYSIEPDERPLSNQLLYVPFKGADILYRFRPDPQDAIDDERKQGMMQRTFTVTVSYKEGLRTHRKSRTVKFAVRLNPDQIVRRVPTHLGNILGLTPKSMR